MLVLPLTLKGKALYSEAAAHFSHNFIALLADALKTYKPKLALALLKHGPLNDSEPLSAMDLRDIMRFSQGQCGYDLVMASILRWLPRTLAKHHEQITLEDAELLVMRVLQHHDWQTCCTALSISGRQAALEKMQQAIATLVGLSANTDCPRKN